MFKEDGDGNVISALDEIGNAGRDAIRMYTRVGLPFDSEIDSMPFSAGTILAGPDSGPQASDEVEKLVP